MSEFENIRFHIPAQFVCAFKTYKLQGYPHILCRGSAIDTVLENIWSVGVS